MVNQSYKWLIEYAKLLRMNERMEYYDRGCHTENIKIVNDNIKEIFFKCFFFTYGWNFTDPDNFMLQHLTRIIRIMHYSPTMRRIPTPAVCTRTLAEGVHRGGSLTIRTTRHTCAALIILLLISPTSDGWKAESTLPLRTRKHWTMNPAT